MYSHGPDGVRATGELLEGVVPEAPCNRASDYRPYVDEPRKWKRGKHGEVEERRYCISALGEWFLCVLGSRIDPEIGDFRHLTQALTIGTQTAVGGF